MKANRQDRILDTPLHSNDGKRGNNRALIVGALVLSLTTCTGVYTNSQNNWFDRTVDRVSNEFSGYEVREPVQTFQTCEAKTSVEKLGDGTKTVTLYKTTPKRFFMDGEPTYSLDTKIEGIDIKNSTSYEVLDDLLNAQFKTFLIQDNVCDMYKNSHSQTKDLITSSAVKGLITTEQSNDLVDRLANNRVLFNGNYKTN